MSYAQCPVKDCVAVWIIGHGTNEFDCPIHGKFIMVPKKAKQTKTNSNKRVGVGNEAK